MTYLPRELSTIKATMKPCGARMPSLLSMINPLGKSRKSLMFHSNYGASVNSCHEGANIMPLAYL